MTEPDSSEEAAVRSPDDSVAIENMRVYKYADEMAEVSRSRQWTAAESNPSHRYYDFREQPELIHQVLEDFAPHSDQPAVQEFYVLLRNINGPGSQFETNDCALSSPKPNMSRDASPLALQVSGRLMFYFRDIPLNTRRDYVEWLEGAVQFYLYQLTPGFGDGVVGTSIMKMHMPELGSPQEPADGFELCLHFWSWGNTEDEAWANLTQVIINMHRTLAALSQDVSEKGYLAET